MIKEALQLLIDVGRKSDSVQAIPLPGHRVGVVRGDGIEVYDKDRAARLVRVETLASFCRWVNSIGRGRDVQIVVGEKHVTATLDIEQHINDVCILPLEPSAAFMALQDWSQQPSSVPDVVRLLRTALDGTFDKKHLPTFRRVDFQRIKATAQKVSHAGESLGRTVEKMAQSADGEIPETLTFDLEIFELDVPFAKRKLSYAVEVNCDSERVAIMPIGDGVSQALKAIKAELLTWLDSALPDCLILAGANE